MRLYIIRHADPDYDNQTITARGHLEAQALARRLAAERITHIYCSPVPRALHTMEYTRLLVGLEPITEPWLRELDWVLPFGEEHELAAWNLPGELIRERAAMPSHLTWHRIPQLKDTTIHQQYEELVANSDQFFTRHGCEREGGRYRIPNPNQDRIAVFCHGGLGLTWLAHLLELPPPLVWCGFWLPPSSVTTVLFEHRTELYAVPRCMAVGDTSHLYDARLPVCTHGLLGNLD